MTDCCNNAVDAAYLTHRQKKTLIWVLAINGCMFFLTVFFGLFSGSSSLLSGSIDNLGDTVTYGLSLYAVKQGNDVKARISLLKGGLILFAAIAVSAQVIYKIINPAVPIFELMGVIGVLSLIANFASLLLLWEHRRGDISMASVWECSRNDVIENCSVLIAALGVWLLKSQWPDTVVALALIIILFRSAFRIIGRSLDEMKKHSNL